jgi:signal transduction histidine kinase
LLDNGKESRYQARLKPMLTKEIILESITKPNKIFRRATMSERKDRKTWLFFHILRFVTVLVAATQIFVFQIGDYSLFPSIALISGTAAYVLIETLYPMHWYRVGLPLSIMLLTDVAISVLLVLTTGGLYTPFLIFTLLPVLRSGLFMNGKITVSVALVSAAYVALAHVFNPFYNLRDDSELSFYFIYLAAVILSSILPYLININFRQRLKSTDVLQERQRLSHEIHDGCAQTVAALRWQVQLLQRKLREMGVDLQEASELERLANQAQFEMRESLELLRNYRGEGDFLPYLTEYLETLKKQTGVQYTLTADGGRMHLEPGAELELLRICQEALVNIRKHAKARKVNVDIKSTKGMVEVIIADDGRGFDTSAHNNEGVQSKGHGLAIMRERAQSIAANFEVTSAPEKGSRIRVEVPTEGNWK